MRRLDIIIATIAVLLITGLGFTLFRGDQVGVGVLQTYPADAEAISRYGRIGVTFEEPMQAAANTTLLTFTPAISGETYWEENTLWFTPAELLDPETIYTATLAPGLKADSGRAVLQETTWSFPVRGSYIAYVNAPNTEREIWLTRVDTGQSKQVTFSDGGVFDLDVAADGTRLVYSQLNDAFGFDFWLWTDNATEASVILECGLDRCSEPTFSPDGKKIAYSRENAPPQVGQSFAPPRVWVLDLLTGENTPLYADKQILGFSPRWSPDQEWLAIFDSNGNQIRAYHFASDTDFAFSSFLGTTGYWLPNSQHMIFNSIDLEADGQPQRVYLADVIGKTVTSITDSDDTYKISSTTVPSPVTGDLLVSVRPTGYKPGSQLWLFPANGSLPQAITDTDGFTYNNARWHPNGRQIIAQEIALEEAYATPDIVLIDLDTGVQRTLVEDAGQGHWMP